MDSDARRRWEHDLRNAVNSTQLSIDVASKMIAIGNLEGAESNLRRALEAMGIMTSLLNPTDMPPID